MSDVPGWLKLVAGVALAALLAALVKPAVAGLVLRVLAVGLAAMVAVLAVRLVVGKLDPVDGIGREPDPRAPGDLPRELASLTEELRGIQRRDQSAAPRAVRAARRDPASAVATPPAVVDQPERRRRRSAPRCRATPTPSCGTTHAEPPPLISATALPALIEEIERL